MRTLHLVSHTHWDREWYLTFQQFRLKLVQMMDQLLDLLETDPSFRHFMLDGQTILLDDYLQIRPERREQIREFVQSGRVLIGPWFVLPDEFLVSPEAIIRNLLEGERIARAFGKKMQVGYIPDPFGHIGQMPQILRGFGINTACLQRGLSDEPLEFWWQAPDGSRVFMVYLRFGYGNAVGLPSASPELFTSEIRRRRDRLLKYSPSARNLLFMQGNDHWLADAQIPHALSYANSSPDLLDGDRVVHSTLPDFISAVRAENQQLATVTGELRSSRRHNLLPGVLSTRMWIKQRNHACQTQLENWAEPFSTFAGRLMDRYASPEMAGARIERLENPEQILRQAWRYLLQCHPHDSICGCSIDQVHEEMKPRFDQVEQIGEEITHQSLSCLARMSHTLPPPPLSSKDILTSAVAFNPRPGSRSEAVEIELELPHDVQGFEITDESGSVVPHQVINTEYQELLDLWLDREMLKDLFRQMQTGRVNGLSTLSLSVDRERNHARIRAVMAKNGELEPDQWQAQQAQISSLLEDDSLSSFRLLALSPLKIRVVFLAQQVPGFGMRTFWIRRSTKSDMPIPGQPGDNPSVNTIENEFLSVQASPVDGTFSLLDKITGRQYPGLNRFVDGGDRGDEYNYSPPANDQLVGNARVQSISVERGAVWQTIQVRLTLPVPRQLSPDRQSRSAELVELPVLAEARLIAGVPRLEFHTQVDNQALDHRLRVHFPLPFVPNSLRSDGHFQIVERALELPAYDQNWTEDPRPEMPQRAFSAASGPAREESAYPSQDIQLLLANRGLPEIELLDSETGAEFALTLLRCVGWLSRGDIPERKGPAGPILPTPQAQMPGAHTFDYAVILSPAQDVAAYQQAYAFNLPLRALQTGLHTGIIPHQATFLDIAPASFTISSVKTSEDGSGWLVRGYNQSDQVLPVHLKAWPAVQSACQANMIETTFHSMPVESDGSLHFSAGPYEIITLKFPR